MRKLALKKVACKDCKRLKPLTEYDSKASRNRHERCRACEYPVCAACSYYHPAAKRAVQERMNVNNQWFCERSKACLDAARLAKKTLKKQVPKCAACVFFLNVPARVYALGCAAGLTMLKRNSAARLANKVLADMDCRADDAQARQF